MKNAFPGYYRPTDKEFSELWRNCLFVLDANVLLGLYRYSPKTRDGLINILKTVGERLWVPHQAALEYHKNRLAAIEEPKRVYEEINDLLKKCQENLEGGLSSYRRRHPSIDPDRLINKMKEAFSSLEKELKMHRIMVPDLRKKDHIRDSITSLLEKKVGPPFPLEKLEEIYEEGKRRYKHRVPPGYKDESPEKEGADQYGDLVLWYQIIEKAKEFKKPIILITEETKEDWWQLFKGSIIGPHPKLIEEMQEKAGIRFYMYRVDPFMEHAETYLKLEVDKEAIKEVREVRKSEEERIRMKPLAYFYSGLSEDVIKGLGRKVQSDYDMLRKIGREGKKAEDMIKNLAQARSVLDEYILRLARPLQELHKSTEQRGKQLKFPGHDDETEIEK